MRLTIILFIAALSAVFLGSVYATNLQTVYIQESQISNDNQNQIVVDVIHETNNLEQLRGLGLTLQYDVNALELIDVKNHLSQDSIAINKELGVIRTAWASVSNTWKISSQQRLYTVVFQFKTNSHKSTNIDIQANSISNGYEFIGETLTIYR